MVDIPCLQVFATTIQAQCVDICQWRTIAQNDHTMADAAKEREAADLDTIKWAAERILKALS